jgi:hypothetical protein
MARLVLEHAVPTTDGELNYCITNMCLKFLGSNPRYTDFNTVIGVLECAKLEMYRRAVAPYEDTKIIENGDVYRNDRDAVVRSETKAGAEAA